MRILFINHSFPGLFASLASALAADPGHEIFFASSYGRQERPIPGVRKIRLGTNETRARTASGELESMVMAGRQALRSFEQLTKNGLAPDMVISSSSGGYSLFWETAFPNAFRVSWTESVPVFPDRDMALEPVFTRHLVQCRQALSAHLAVSLTAGQPGILGNSLETGVELPYAVDTERFAGVQGSPLIMDEQDVASFPELVLLAVSKRQTGDPYLARLLTALLAKRPLCHVVLFCDTMTTRALMKEYCARLPESIAKGLHISGMLSLNKYKSLMGKARALVYPPGCIPQATALLDAMSCGAALVLAGEGHIPCILKNDSNALVLDDFQEAEDFAGHLSSLLDQEEKLRAIGSKARQTVCIHFDQKKVLPLQVAFLLEMYQIRKEKGDAALREALRTRKNPTTGPIRTHDSCPLSTERNGVGKNVFPVGVPFADLPTHKSTDIP